MQRAEETKEKPCALHELDIKMPFDSNKMSNFGVEVKVCRTSPIFHSILFHFKPTEIKSFWMLHFLGEFILWSIARSENYVIQTNLQIHTNCWLHAINNSCIMQNNRHFSALEQILHRKLESSSTNRPACDAFWSDFVCAPRLDIWKLL